VIDYCLCSRGILSCVSDFFVHTPCVFTDHCMVQVTLDCNVNCQYCQINMSACINCEVKKVKWKEDKKEEFVANLQSRETNKHIQEVMSLLDNENINETTINTCLEKLGGVLLTAGKSHNITVGRKAYSNTRLGSWYDSDCMEKRELFKCAERRFRVTGCEDDRMKMCDARNKYRRLCKLKRRNKNIDKAMDLVALSQHNNKLFWKSIRKKKNDPNGTCDFNHYFKNLNSIQPFMSADADELVSNWEKSGAVRKNTQLDEQISMIEINIAIKKLKHNKEPGLDNILNDFLKNSNIDFISAVRKLFNAILNSGLFPNTWAIGEIVPIYKRGDKNNPGNYRGITLLSCLGKLFTSILNNRLCDWAEENGIFCESQFGFRKRRSTVDCMFILHGIIEILMNRSKPLFCAFVDLQKAFDSTNRRVLWYKLNMNGVSGKLINIIRNMYSKIKLCVRDYSKNLTGGTHETPEYFTSYAGVFQGESLSPFLFSMFLNDLRSALEIGDESGVKLDTLLLTVLLFADDMVLFSESRNGLQMALDNLSNYCSQWGLTVNIDKTKCVVFRKGGKLNRLDKWNYDYKQLETASHFKYLGFDFGSSGKFAIGIQALVDQSNKALFGLKRIIHQYPEMTAGMQIKLFHALILPILSYGCEVWGFCAADQIEKMYLRFLKSVLGVRKNVPTAFVFSELNLFPLLHKRLILIFKYWLKIVQLPNNNIVKVVYNMLLREVESNNDITNWVSLLKKTLEENGLGFIWIQQDAPDRNWLLQIYKQRLDDVFLQKRNGDIAQLSEHRLYKNLCTSSDGGGYINFIRERFLRVALSKLRLGSHNLMIERGRWERPMVEYSSRTCEVCGVVEDEYHVFIECPRFNNLRNTFLPISLIINPSMKKFVHFLNTAREKQLRMLALFCHKMFIQYDNEVT